MSGRRFVSAAWLMSVCVLFGCASGPSRNFFSRRAKPTTSEDEFVNRLMADAKRMEKKGNRASANNLREEANAIAASSATFKDSTEKGASVASRGRPVELPDDVAEQPMIDVAQAKAAPKKPKFSLNDDASATARLQLDGDADDFTQTLREPPKKQLGGGQFGVASRLPIEAPAPKRRADSIQNAIDSAGPGQFYAPPDARELIPLATDNDRSPPFVDQFEPNARRDANFEVISADYQTNNQPFDNAQSGVIQAGASERSASGLQDPENPWSQFRGLTKPLEPTPLELRNNDSRRFAPSNNQVAPNNGFNNINAPEPWPRAPGANGVARPNDNSSANAQGWTDTQPVGATASQYNIQPINNVQSPFTSAVIPGFNFPPQQSPTTTALLTDAPTNNAVLFPLPNGAPLAIAPFVSSPDLDRLIVQTSAEAAAMIPGENEIERHAYLRKHVQLRLLQIGRASCRERVCLAV